jgi:quinol monooxygenase YgiN
MPITSIAFFHAKPGQEGALGALLTQLGDSSPGAPGCVDCVVHQSPDEPELWFVYETWDSENALEASFESERLRRFVRAAAPLMSSDMRLGLFKPVRGAGVTAAARGAAPQAPVQL